MASGSGPGGSAGGAPKPVRPSAMPTLVMKRLMSFPSCATIVRTVSPSFFFLPKSTRSARTRSSRWYTRCSVSARMSAVRATSPASSTASISTLFASTVSYMF